MTINGVDETKARELLELVAEYVERREREGTDPGIGRRGGVLPGRPLDEIAADFAARLS